MKAFRSRHEKPMIQLNDKRQTMKHLKLLAIFIIMFLSAALVGCDLGHDHNNGHSHDTDKDKEPPKKHENIN